MVAFFRMARLRRRRLSMMSIARGLVKPLFARCGLDFRGPLALNDIRRFPPSASGACSRRPSCRSSSFSLYLCRSRGVSSSPSPLLAVTSTRSRERERRAVIGVPVKWLTFSLLRPLRRLRGMSGVVVALVAHSSALSDHPDQTGVRPPARRESRRGYRRMTWRRPRSRSLHHAVRFRRHPDASSATGQPAQSSRCHEGAGRTPSATA